MAGFVPAMDKALGKGTDQPGLHVTLRPVQSKGKYVAGQDTPVYDATGGPHCYSVPYTGRAAPTADARTASSAVHSAPGDTATETEPTPPSACPTPPRRTGSSTSWSPPP